MDARTRFSDIYGEGFTLLRRLIRPRKRVFAIGVIGAAMFASAIIASAQVVAWVTDTIIIPSLDDGADVSLSFALWIIGAIAIWKSAGIVVRRIAAGYLMYQAAIDTRRELLIHQLKLDMPWFAQQATGDLLSVSEVDTGRATFILGPLPFATGAILLLIGSTIIMFVTDVWFGVVTTIGITLTLAGELEGMRRSFDEDVKAQELRGELAAVAHESFDGALTVKALGRENYERLRFEEVSERLRDVLIHLGIIWGKFRSVVEAIPQLTIVAILVVGAARIGATLTAGDIVAAAFLMSLLALPMHVIGFVTFDLAESTAAWRRVRRVLEVDEFVVHGDMPADPSTHGAEVDADDVGFSYPASEPILSDVSFEIPGGKTIALVGRTAAGKSTVAVLLARLWDPATGEISLDNRTLRSFADGELPTEMAYVAQETFLFDDTIAANIRLGAPIDDDQVASAIDLASAGFVHDLPDGIHTLIGERGATLSGGQRQRVALARALVRRPRLLILDDATSAVDPSVESQILAGLRDAALPSTVLLVAYRPSSITLADAVVFIDEGRIIAQGRHADLLANEPRYAALLTAYSDDATRRSEERPV